MVDWIKCVPFVGTAISACETAEAVVQGNGKKALWKLGETAVGGAMDVLTVFSVGTSAIATTSAKTAAKVAASAAIKNVAGATFIRGVSTTLTGKAAEECVGSGGGGGGGKRNPPNQPPRRDHDRDDSDSDSDSELTEDELSTVEDPELLEKLIEKRLEQLTIHPDPTQWRNMDVNSNNGTTNCYYVSIAAIMKKTLFEAIDESQEFAQNGATIEEFCHLCRLFNLEAQFPELLNEKRARQRNDVLMENLGSILKPGRKRKFVLAYRTRFNTYHMIVLVAGKTRKGEVFCTLIDFQKRPQEPVRFPTLQDDEEILYIIKLKKSKKKP